MALPVFIRSLGKALVLIAVGHLALAIYFSLDQLKECANPLTADPFEHPECFFSPTYLAAQALFRHKVARAGGVLHTLPISETLGIDVAVFKGRDESDLVIHVSGTHGVEGYVGSAIQTAALTLLVNRTRQLDKTIIFIHGLNPFGMTNWRRVNENNVDLNRNAVFDEAKLQELLNRDPNIAGYEDCNNLLNPQQPPTFFNALRVLFDATSLMTTMPFSSIKRAIVTGTYTRPKGIFFGGTFLQPSHLAIQRFLQREGFLDHVRKVLLIDVHSGLGPHGRDTLMTMGHVDTVKRLFGNSTTKIGDVTWVPPYAIEEQTKKVGEGNHASDGYDLVKGMDVQSSYPKLFTKAEFAVGVTQEFGSYSALVVAFNLVTENQAFHWGSNNDKLAAGRRLKHVFSPDSQSFAAMTINRGVLLLLQSL